MKKVKLKIRQGFTINISQKQEKSIVHVARSQCRTRHKRKDC